MPSRMGTQTFCSMTAIARSLATISSWAWENIGESTDMRHRKTTTRKLILMATTILTRISHQFATATAHASGLTAFRSLDLLHEYDCGGLGRKPCQTGASVGAKLDRSSPSLEARLLFNGERIPESQHNCTLGCAPHRNRPDTDPRMVVPRSPDGLQGHKHSAEVCRLVPIPVDHTGCALLLC
jgi:hypothetical protein